jgi:hypothetical protein
VACIENADEMAVAVGPDRPCCVAGWIATCGFAEPAERGASGRILPRAPSGAATKVSLSAAPEAGTVATDADASPIWFPGSATFEAWLGMAVLD